MKEDECRIYRGNAAEILSEEGKLALKGDSEGFGSTKQYLSVHVLALKVR